METENIHGVAPADSAMGLGDPPAKFPIRAERVCVSFIDPDMQGLVHDVLAAEYPWFASMNLMFTPAGKLNDPATIEIVASAEVTCAIPENMTSEQVADELRAAVSARTRQRIEEIGNMLREFGMGKAELRPGISVGHPRQVTPTEKCICHRPGLDAGGYPVLHRIDCPDLIADAEALAKELASSI